MKRIGRFVFHGEFGSPTRFAVVKITCDHLNGEENVYQFPTVGLDDARDLIHGLQQLIRNAEGLDR